MQGNKGPRRLSGQFLRQVVRQGSQLLPRPYISLQRQPGQPHPGVLPVPAFLQAGALGLFTGLGKATRLVPACNPEQCHRIAHTKGPLMAEQPRRYGQSI